MIQVVVGYRDWPGNSCPYCHGSYAMIEDIGEEGLYQYRCWCGATAKVRREDPDLLRLLNSQAQVEDDDFDPFVDL